MSAMGKISGRAIRALSVSAGVVASAWAMPGWSQTAGADYGPVKSGDSLYRVARRALDDQPQANINDYVRAIFEANPHAFAGGDINRLRAGATLALPALEGAPAPTTVEPESEPEPQVPDVPPAPESEPAASAMAMAFGDTALGQRAAKALRAGTIAGLYGELAAVEPEYSGNPNYDYALGVAALDSGAKSEALYPLQRASTVRPAFFAARMDYARALYEVGDLKEARTQFSILRDQNPPPVAAGIIDEYLTAIQRRDRAARTRLVGSVGIEGGFDTNANSATSALDFLGFELDPQARSTESPFAGVLLDGRYSRPLQPRLRFELAGSGGYREYFDADFVTGFQYSLNTGLVYTRGTLAVDGRLSGGQQWLDGEHNNDVLALSGGASNAFSTYWRLGGGLRYAQVRYDDEVAIRDVDQWILSVNAHRTIESMGGGLLTFGLLGGVDDAVEANSPNDRTVFGGSVDAAIHPQSDIQLFSRLAGLFADYDKPFFGDLERQDTQLTVELGANYINPQYANWVLTGSVRYLDNQSDIELYDYDRTVATVQLRRNFE